MAERRKSSPTKWTTVTTFADAGTANVAKLRLERAEIPCYLDDENTAMTLWHVQPAIGGIKLKVPEQYVEEARRALDRRLQDAQDGDDVIDSGKLPDQEAPDDAEQGAPDEVDQDLTDPDYDDEDVEGVCPSCHSEDVTPFSWRRRIGQALVVLLLLAPLAVFGVMFLTISLVAVIYTLITKPDFRCTRCGKRWTAADARLG